jgi:hypothetical protein
MRVCIWLFRGDLRYNAVLWYTLRLWRYLRDQWQLLLVHVCIWLLWGDVRYHAVLWFALREWWYL